MCQIKRAKFTIPIIKKKNTKTKHSIITFKKQNYSASNGAWGG